MIIADRRVSGELYAAIDSLGETGTLGGAAGSERDGYGGRGASAD